jgi:hypothetical protein
MLVRCGSTNNVQAWYYSKLHTQAKSCDHEIVRAQMKCLKAIPRHLQNHVVWSRALKRGVKSHVTGPSSTV